MKGIAGSLICASVLMMLCVAVCASDFADQVVDCVNPGFTPYDDPLSVLGQPTTLIYDPGWPPY